MAHIVDPLQEMVHQFRVLYRSLFPCVSTPLLLYKITSTVEFITSLSFCHWPTCVYRRRLERCRVITNEQAWTATVVARLRRLAVDIDLLRTAHDV